MSVLVFTAENLHQLNSVQPEGWQPITPTFQFYLQSPFCFPTGFFIEETLAGVGTIIFHGQTAWLAHIIVNSEHRNKGIGTQITKALIRQAERKQCKTISLLATPLGEPVYAKLGFKKELDYIFLQHAKPDQRTSHNSILSYDERYDDQILKLDRDVLGEDRAALLMPHIKSSKLISEHGTITGFYMPTLGEGLVIAEDSKTGMALLSERLSPGKNRIALPEENKTAIDFLAGSEYTEFGRGSRMYLGDKLPWQPSKLYSRIGGNLG